MDIAENAPLCQHISAAPVIERIRMEIGHNFPADAALTPRKKRGFTVGSVAGSRSRDYQSNPYFQCGIALTGVCGVGESLISLAPRQSMPPQKNRLEQRVSRLWKQKRGLLAKSPYFLVELGRIELPTS